MELSEALMRLREVYLSGRHQMGGMFFHAEAMDEVCGADDALKAAVVKALDEASPLKNFHVWTDGGVIHEEPDGEFWIEYHHDRKPAEIAGVIGRAAMRAKEAA